MRPAQFSRTAYGVAAYRAAHQLLEGGAIFHDPFARAILGAGAEEAIAQRSAPRHKIVRFFMAVRSRFAEDSLAVAWARGARQAVLLGAGLDTFALRNSHAGLAVFEVDHPETQAWKQECLAQARLAIPQSLSFAPVDFERERLADGLAAAGFDAGKPAFFIWLGVVPYLTLPAIHATLDYVSGVPSAEIVFDYSEPLENYAPEGRARMEAAAARVAAAGEPWISHFDPAVLAGLLRGKGFNEIEDMAPAIIAERYLNAPPGEKRETVGAHVVRARQVGRTGPSPVLEVY
jgi:methyltransferase (TIGR00027 family)